MSVETEGQHVVTELTKEMVTLMKMVTNTFYKTEEALIIDILIKHPCIREDDLIDLLKFDKKQTQASLVLLKKDKLIKSITKGDRDVVGPNGGILKSNYYFINYKVFINVVKYKLDRMRRKIEQEDKLTQDCQFHLCQECDLRFSDLDVRELYDLESGTLRCKHCGSELVEDIQKIKSLQDRSMVSKFNDQTKVFTDLLRKTDNIKLADELLTPQPLKLKSSENRSRPVKLWQTSGKEYNLYQESSIKVNLDADKESNKRQKKEMPVWLAKSTVVNEETPDTETARQAKQETMKITALKDDYISQLIQNEVMTSSAPTSGSSSPAYEDADKEAEEEEEEEDTRKWLVSVGGDLISLTEIDEDHVARMTDAEKDLYNQKYREYCDSIMM